ncbi:Iron(3+)-hydroxamate import ATP-binding protein FhuC [Phycisphaerae bacterium RAS1]|nr:Iron(3+)-hydroxamate import ATP-binding protein FhuC [Phycisphaerae bacterium RAS1]
MNTPASANGKWELVCRDARLRRGRQDVIHGVSLSIRAGQCVALIGPNGAGKTTLMLGLLGLIPPAAGAITWDGAAMHRIAPRRRARLAAYVPQTTERLPPMSVHEVVAGGRYAHVPPLRPLSAADDAVVRDALARCGLADLATRSIDAVSAGERQKTLLAAALAQDAEALLLDEPTTSLDPAHQVELVRLLRELHAAGRAVILISHDLQLPAAVCDRVIAIREGRMAADGPPAAVLNAEALRAIYGTEFEVLDTPHGRRFITPQWW